MLCELARRVDALCFLKKKMFVGSVSLLSSTLMTDVGRFTDKVVESRCRALELFLKRVLGHEQLCDHPDVVGFLCEEKSVRCC